MNKKQIGKRLSIVIVTHNSEAVIAKCLENLPKTVRIIIVDNNSSDKTYDIVYNNFPAVEFLKNKTNDGFGRANNKALGRIDTDYALLLNPDTMIEKNSLEQLIEVAEGYKDAAIVAPILYLEDGSLQKSYKDTVFAREKSKSNFVKPEGDICAKCLSGAVMLVRMECFKNIGFFDPNIFLFYEDDDLCLKAQAAGYSSILTPRATAVHLMGRSSPVTLGNIYLKNWHIMWSRLYIQKKYKGFTSSFTLAFKQIFIYTLKSLAYFIVFNRKKSVKSLARAIASGAFLVSPL